jgi:CRP/FNR family transcriptional regulator, cyclic AMP receptor protein
MEKDTKFGFDIAAYLANAGPGRRIVQLDRDEVFFSQGTPADCVFYLHKGRVKITVVSAVGKEATIRLVAAKSFFGEKAMESIQGPRVSDEPYASACAALLRPRSAFG